MDIGGIIKAPFEDPQWLKKLLLMGAVNVLICITIIGIFVGLPNLMGWGITFARNRMNGQKELPEFGFGYIGLGYRSIVAGLSMIVIALVVGIICGILSAILGKIAAPLALIPMLIQLVVLVPVGIAAMYRFVVHDDMLPGIRFGWLMSFIPANLGTLFFAFVILIIVELITMAMGIVPIVGGLFGAGFGVAAINALYAEMARVTNRA